MNQFAIPPNVAWAALVAVCALVASTLVRWATLRHQPREIASSRIESLKTWWIVSAIVIGAAVAGPLAVVVLLALVSLISLREFASLPFRPTIHRQAWIAGYGVIVTGYIALLAREAGFFTMAIPLLAVVAPSIAVIVSGHASNFTNHVGRIALALLLTTYGLGHLGLLAMSTPQSNPGAGPIGLFLFVVAVTELNDIAQALVGRRFGRHQLTAISPKKTWEGFAGGVVAAMIAAVMLGQWFTELTAGHLALVGILMSVAGLLGDLSISAVKREVGVKDSGSLLPGQGGILDRIDSLTFTAPLFYYYWFWFCR